MISLDASDDFLKTRVMNLPERVVAGTHNTEEGTHTHARTHAHTHTHTHTHTHSQDFTNVHVSLGLLRRLSLFRSQNEEDNTVLNYFDELEIHPEHIGMYICHDIYTIHS